jgi:hypothetical protein
MLTAVLALAWAPSAWAACTVDSQPVFHGFGGFIASCPDANPVTGFVYLLSSPGTVNSGNQSNLFVCEEAFAINGISLACQGEAGAIGDGNVTVLYDFGIGNPGAVGCPNPAQTGNGATPVAAQVLCNNGASALISVGYSEDLLQFILEYGGPADFSPVHAGFGSSPSLTSVGAGPSPSATNVCVNVPPPVVNSDCDGTSLGFGYSCPDAGARLQFTRGQLYILEAPCGSSPDPRVNTTPIPWVAASTQPDLSGDACNMVNTPTVPGMCTFVGATGRVGPTETGAMVGWFQVGGPAASNDKVKIDHAGFAQGKVVVAFSTINETSIVGFNVYSGANKLNGSLIAARGAGSNPYNFEVGRGALKGGKSVLVEAVKSNGTVERTAPVSLK